MPSVYHQLPLFPFEKRCRLCGQTKPIWHYVAAGRAFRTECRDCQSAYNRAYREKYGAALKAGERARYAASPELQQRAVAAVRAYRAADPEKTRARRHAEYLARLERYPGMNRAFYEKHKERIKARAKMWRRQHPEEHRRWAKEHQAQHRSIIKAWEQRNYEHLMASKRAWKKAHPLHAVVGAHIRRARLRSAEGRYTVDDVRRIYQEQGGLCAYCKEALQGRFDVEHRIPLCRGGSNGPENIVCACPPCNGRKSKLTDTEFMAKLSAEKQAH